MNKSHGSMAKITIISLISFWSWAMRCNLKKWWYRCLSFWLQSYRQTGQNLTLYFIGAFTDWINQNRVLLLAKTSERPGACQIELCQAKIRKIYFKLLCLNPASSSDADLVISFQSSIYWKFKMSYQHQEDRANGGSILQNTRSKLIDHYMLPA